MTYDVETTYYEVMTEHHDLSWDQLTKYLRSLRDYQRWSEILIRRHDG